VYALPILIPLFSITAALCAADLYAEDQLTGSLSVVGRGPERLFVEELARAFEKSHVGTAIDIQWGYTLNIDHMVKAGDVDIAVSDRAEEGLVDTPLALEGIAIIVNFANPISDLTTKQLTDVFTGNVTSWSELHDRGVGKIEVIGRPDDRNLNYGLVQSLGLGHRVIAAHQVLRSDQSVVSRVSGNLHAISYVSLRVAMEAVTYGSPIRILSVDGAEAATPRIKSGQYKLRRLIVLLSSHSTPLIRAFLRYSTSTDGKRLLNDFYVPY
jgi:phosphate transport system substrate-binding protein